MKKSFHILILILFIGSFGLKGQDTESGDPSRDKLISAAHEIIASSGACSLITLDKQGQPRARPMDAFPPENDLTVWFATNPKSRKVEQIKNDPRVTLYYVSDDESGYVTIHGKASLINDPKEKEKRWKEEWEMFYPNRDEAYLLIKVSPQWMEVISYSHGITGNPETWEPERVDFNKEK